MALPLCKMPIDTLTTKKRAGPAKQTAFAADIAAGVLLSGIALLLLFVLIPYGVDAPRKVKFAALHPAYYPRIVSWCLLIFGCATLVVAFRKKISAQASSFDDPIDSTTASGSDTINPANALVSEVKDKTTGQRVFSLAILSTVFACVTFFLPTLGFPLTTALTLLVVMPLAGEYRVWLILTVAVCLPMLLYLFFSKVANIPIPGGVLDPWLLKL